MTVEQKQVYTEIVRRFADPDGDFSRLFRNTLRKYRPTLSDDNIKDLFQDSFLAARKNLLEGRIRENSSWDSYLITIGLNLAARKFREFGRFTSLDDDSRAPVVLSEGAGGLHADSFKNLTEEEVAVYNEPQVQRLLEESLGFMNDNCKKILTLTLYDRLSSEEIAAQMNSTPRSIITRRNRCKQVFVELIKSSLRRLGYDVK